MVNDKNGLVYDGSNEFVFEYEYRGGTYIPKPDPKPDPELEKDPVLPNPTQNTDKEPNKDQNIEVIKTTSTGKTTTPVGHVSQIKKSSVQGLPRTSDQSMIGSVVAMVSSALYIFRRKK